MSQQNYGYSGPPGNEPPPHQQVVVTRTQPQLVGRRLKPEAWCCSILLCLIFLPLAFIPCCISDCYENVYASGTEVTTTTTGHAQGVPVAQPYKA